MLLNEVRKLIQFCLTEGVDQDRKELIELFPQSEGELSALPPKWIMWLNLRFGKDAKVEEVHPFEDALATVLAYSKRDSAISQKYSTSEQWRTAVDAEFPNKKWKNPADVMTMSSDDMETLLAMSQRKKQNIDASKTENVEGDKIAKIGPWTLWMPTTRENSCQIAGYDPKTLKPATTWCTARTSGSNLFYNYTTSEANIILFYLIKDGAKTTNDRLSVGFQDGNPVLKGEGGGLSVNAMNKGLTKKSLQSILSDHFDAIMNKLTETAKKYSGKHPAKTKIEQACQSINILKNITNGQSRSEKESIFLQVLRQKISEEVARYIYAVCSTGIENSRVLRKLGNNDGTPADVLILLSNSEDPDIRLSVINNLEKVPKEIANKLLNDPIERIRKVMLQHADLSYDDMKKIMQHGKLHDLQNLAKNKNLPEDIAIKLANNQDDLIKYYLLRNFESLQPSVVNVLLDCGNEDIINSVLQNDITGKISDAKLIELANNENPRIRELLADKRNLPKYIFEKLLDDENPNVIASMLKSEYATEEQLRKFSTSKKATILAAVAKNKNTPVDVAIKLATDPSKKVRYYLTLNNNIDDKVLQILMNDPDNDNKTNAIRMYNKRQGITK